MKVKPFKSLEQSSALLRRRCEAGLTGERVFATIDFGKLDSSKFKEAMWDALEQIRAQVADYDVLRYLGFAELVALEACLERRDTHSAIHWAHSNFDTGGGDYFIEPLSAFLVASGRIREAARLWKGVGGIRARYVREFFEGMPVGFRSESHHLNALWDQALEAINRLVEILRTTEQEDELQRAELILADFKANRRAASKPTSDKRKIDEDLFWSLIAEAGAGLDYPTQVADHLANRLEAFGPAQIRSFARILHRKMAESYRNDLWAVAYIIRGGCGDDAFEYFRGWLIAAGREVFEAALEDPSSVERALEPGVDPQLELMLCVADLAYENKTGEPLILSGRPFRLRGESWQEEDLATLYPELSARWGQRS